MDLSVIKDEKLRGALEKSSKFNELDESVKSDFLQKLAFVRKLEEVEKIVEFLEDDQEVEAMKRKTLKDKKEFFLGKLRDFEAFVKKLKVSDESQFKRGEGADDVSRNLID